MKVVKKIISYILIFVLIIILLAGILLTVIKNTVLNEEYLISKLEKVNYYENIHNTIKDELEDYVEQSGLENFDIGNVFSVEQIKKDVNELVRQIYHGEQIKTNEEEINQLLENKLAEIEQNGTKLTAVEKNATKTVFENISKTYLSEVYFNTYQSLLASIPQKVLAINEVIPKICIGLYVTIGVFIVITLVINFREITTGIKYIGIVALTVGFLLIGLNIFLKTNINISNFYILSRGISDLIAAMFMDIMGKINMAGIVLAVIGLLFVVIEAINHKNKATKR